MGSDVRSIQGHPVASTQDAGSLAGHPITGSSLMGSSIMGSNIDSVQVPHFPRCLSPLSPSSGLALATAQSQHHRKAQAGPFEEGRRLGCTLDSRRVAVLQRLNVPWIGLLIFFHNLQRFLGHTQSWLPVEHFGHFPFEQNKAPSC